MFPLNYIFTLQNAEKAVGVILAASSGSDRRTRRSQRQARKARRRAHAAGIRFAFVH